MFEAEDAEVVELGQRLNRPGEVDILQHQLRDPAGLRVARDAEPRPGARAGRFDPGGEGIGAVRGGFKCEQGVGFFWVWVRESNREHECEQAEDEDREKNIHGSLFLSDSLNKAVDRNS